MSFENMNGFFKPDPAEQPADNPCYQEEDEINSLGKSFRNILSRLRNRGEQLSRFDVIDIVGCTVLGGGLIAVICTWDRFMQALFVYVAFPLLQLISSIIGICAIVLVPALFIASRFGTRRRSRGISKWFRW